jgi:hypothetical protein
VAALGLGALFPAVRGVVSIWQRRRLDIIGAIVLVGIAVSIVALLIGGGPRLFLIRESFVTGAPGLLTLTSLVWRRPLRFYIGRQFTAGDDAAAIERCDALWQRASARRTFRLLTIVWAVGWLGEFSLRVAMVPDALGLPGIGNLAVPLQRHHARPDRMDPRLRAAPASPRTPLDSAVTSM